MRKFKLAFLALAAVSGIAAAATQGTLGATSTGSFTNTFNSSPRQVQVLNLADATMTPNSGVVAAPVPWGNTITGAADTFCVVDTGGGAVKLTLSNSNGAGSANGTNFHAKDAAGNGLDYWQYLLKAGDNTVYAYNDLGTTGFTVAAGQTVTAASSCGSGNVFKGITLPGGVTLPTGTSVYTDVVTIVATPV
ncbi:hypothetical protein [uncultured Pseudacidovorax sp.]|uniref:hypothetical protein n=1 Tax=uncultured Pseudacidovorax sp. TaxID=679313 RepID=UPI0025EE19B4|nr:hypothetical protein [uncultured Pseudacidovorax sp.]